MNARAEKAFEGLLNSKAGRTVPEATLRRAFLEALPRYKKLSEADKAVRARVHQIAGAFFDEGERRALDSCLADAASDADGAVERALKLHASTRERSDWRGFYDKLFQLTGVPETVLDLACGLNPLCLGALGLRVRGVEISRAAAEYINRWGEALNWDLQIVCGDLMEENCVRALPSSDIALLMKLLPVLERQRKGASLELLGRLPAPRALVSFPTRSLSGRGKGMEENYGNWFESLIRDAFVIREKYLFQNELCYIVETGG